MYHVIKALPLNMEEVHGPCHVGCLLQPGLDLCVLEFEINGL